MLFFSFSTFPIRCQNIYCSSTLSFSAALFFQHSHTDSVSSKKKPKQPFCEQATFCAQSPRSIRFIKPNYLKKSILNQSKTNVLASII